MKLSNIFKKKGGGWVVIDLVMMLILLANLLLIVFETLFEIPEAQSFIAARAAGFYRFYDEKIHAHFLTIDLYFVGIFLSEFFIHWIVAVKRGVYHRWFFYPFIHWYDLLGSIPLGSFRGLRLLRIVAIGFRLHRLGVIDIRKFYAYRVVAKYTEIVTEELSDRVIIKALESTQAEIRRGSRMSEQIIVEVVLPRAKPLFDEVAPAVEKTIKELVRQHGPSVQRYTDRVIATAFTESDALIISKVPVLGDKVVQMTRRIVQDLVQSIIEQLSHDIKTIDVRDALRHIDTSHFKGFEVSFELRQIMNEILLESIERVKDQVRVQHWKQKEEDPPL